MCRCHQITNLARVFTCVQLLVGSPSNGQIPPTITSKSLLVVKNVRSLKEVENSRTLARLECYAEGDDPITYRWQKDGHHIQNSSLNGTLEVDLKPGSGATGKYQCFASNSWGTASSVEQVLYEIPPWVPKDPNLDSRKLVCDNVPAALLGEVKWTPKSAEDFWWRNSAMGHVPYLYLRFGDEELLNVIENSTRHFVGPDGSLYFTDLRREDAGQRILYDCFVQLQHMKWGTEPLYNLHSFYSGFYYSHIWFKLSLEILFDNSGDVVAMEGEDITFYCISAGRPSPTITWILEDEPVSEMFFEKANMTLILKNVTRHHQNRSYKCIVSNTEQTHSRTFRLLVKAKPKFQRISSDIVANIGSSLNLYCDGSGDPIPSHEWTFNAESLDKIWEEYPNFRFSPDGRELQILAFSNDTSGKYGCKISNTYGNEYAEFSVIPVISKPLVQEITIMESYSVMTSPIPDFGAEVSDSFTANPKLIETEENNTDEPKPDNALLSYGLIFVGIILASFVGMTCMIWRRWVDLRKPRHFYKTVSSRSPDNSGTTAAFTGSPQAVENDGYEIPLPKPKRVESEETSEFLSHPVVDHCQPNRNMRARADYNRESHIYAEIETPPIFEDDDQVHDYDKLNTPRPWNPAYKTMEEIKRKTVSTSK